MSNLVQALEVERVLDIQKHQSKSGLDFYLVSDHSLPIITIDFAFKGAGSMNDPVGKAGLGHLVSNVLDEGAGDRAGQEFQKILQDRAIELTYYNGRDNFGGRLKTLKRHLPIAVELLEDSLMEPRFDNDAIDRMRNANIARVKSSLSNVDWQAARLLNAAYFGDHPYASNSGGTISGLQAVTAQDMRDFVSNFLTKDRLEIALAGDLTADEASEIVDQLFSDLTATGQAQSRLSQVQFDNTGQKIAYESDSPQTAAIMLWPTFSKNDPDYYTLRVLNHILGAGGFSSMLMDRVREQQGLTYGIYSRLSHMDYADYLTIESSTSPENIQQMTESTQAILHELKTQEVSDKALAEAKSYLIGSMPIKFSSTQSLSSTPLSLAMNELPITYLDDWDDNISAVTTEDIQRVAKRIFISEEPSLMIMAGSIPDDPFVTIMENLPGVE